LVGWRGWRGLIFYENAIKIRRIDRVGKLGKMRKEMSMKIMRMMRVRRQFRKRFHVLFIEFSTLSDLHNSSHHYTTKLHDELF
jgi:hypothetical protein